GRRSRAVWRRAGIACSGCSSRGGCGARSEAGGDTGTGRRGGGALPGRGPRGDPGGGPGGSAQPGACRALRPALISDVDLALLYAAKAINLYDLTVILVSLTEAPAKVR